jgi:hypothetical protein
MNLHKFIDFNFLVLLCLFIWALLGAIGIGRGRYGGSPESPNQWGGYNIVLVVVYIILCILLLLGMLNALGAGV